MGVEEHDKVTTPSHADGRLLSPGAPKSEASASTTTTVDDSNADGLKPEASPMCETPGWRARLLHKLKRAFVVWGRQKFKAKKQELSSRKRRSTKKKILKGQRPDATKDKANLSREATAAYLRNSFERFRSLGESPNAAAANALREIAGLAPVFKAKSSTPNVPTMLLPPTSWGAFEPSATFTSDFEAEDPVDAVDAVDAAPQLEEALVEKNADIQETFPDTILDTQSTQLDPETQDGAEEVSQAMEAEREEVSISPVEPIGLVDEKDLLDSTEPVEPEEEEPAKPQPKRRGKAAEKVRDETCQRKTSRQRIAPLEHWKNERCVYERKSGSSAPSLAAIVKCTAAEGEASKRSSNGKDKGKATKVDDPTKRRRKDVVAESTADSADVNLTDHEDVGMVSPPVPSIYDIAEKKNKRRSEKEATPMAPGKKQGTGHAQKDPISKATASNTSKGKAQSSPPRGLMGALEAAREAAKMREIARPLAPATDNAPSLTGFRGKPSLARMAAAAAAAVGNRPAPAREVAAGVAKSGQKRAKN